MCGFLIYENGEFAPVGAEGLLVDKVVLALLVLIIRIMIVEALDLVSILLYSSDNHKMPLVLLLPVLHS